jgi:hypothetical protein
MLNRHQTHLTVPLYTKPREVWGTKSETRGAVNNRF